MSNLLSSGCKVGMNSSNDAFTYLNRPLSRCDFTDGSRRAWSRAIFISVGLGSSAVMLAARVRVRVPLVASDDAEGEEAGMIVRASDSAKMPPPQPISRYRRLFLLRVLVGSMGEDGVVLLIGVDSARQEAMKSWRTGFMRCRTREGPWGSHHDVAREEKWDSSLAETEEWCRVWDLGRVVGVVVRARRVRRRVVVVVEVEIGRSILAVVFLD